MGDPQGYLPGAYPQSPCPLESLATAKGLLPATLSYSTHQSPANTAEDCLSTTSVYYSTHPSPATIAGDYLSPISVYYSAHPSPATMAGDYRTPTAIYYSTADGRSPSMSGDSPAVIENDNMTVDTPKDWGSPRTWVSAVPIGLPLSPETTPRPRLNGLYPPLNDC